MEAFYKQAAVVSTSVIFSKPWNINPERLSM